MLEEISKQPSSILAQLADMRDEIQVDKAGYAYTSIRGAARLCGCDHKTLSSNRKSSPGYLQKLVGGFDVPECLKPFSGMDFRVGGSYM